jgi:hypothetical protein
VVECQLPKLDVTGSSPVSRSKINNLEAHRNRSYCDYCVNRPNLKASFFFIYQRRNPANSV